LRRQTSALDEGIAYGLVGASAEQQFGQRFTGVVMAAWQPFTDDNSRLQQRRGLRQLTELLVWIGQRRPDRAFRPLIPRRRWRRVRSGRRTTLRSRPVIVTTTPGIEGKRITRYCGIVAGEAILGANLFKDVFAGIRDLVGGRSATYERELQRARDMALEEMQEKALAAGGNAIVGVDLDYEVLGAGNGMLMVSASGTAVVVE
jgi:uncharacterized protein YbjQ (UPF0145 family)